MANPRNTESVKALRGLLEGAQTFFLVNYQGLSAGELGALRKKLRETGGRLLVVKNTLMQVVLREQGREGFDLAGPTALVLVGEDPVGPAKSLTDFAKESGKETPAGKGGLLQGAMLDEGALTRIAKLPPREQLLSELVGVLEAPMRQMLGVLQAAPRDLVSVMTNYSEKLKEA
jgi:large subunit ribosomal protein L10